MPSERNHSELNHSESSPCDRQPSDPLSFTVEGLRYRLDALPTPRRRTVVRACHEDAVNAVPLVDKVDFYAYRSRHTLAGRVADTLGRQTGEVLGHLAWILDQVERSQAQERLARRPEKLTPARREAAERLLARPQLLERAGQTLAGLGLVGEERNARLLFLVALSRLLQAPLSALLLAPPGSGKSHLLETVVRLVPEEAVASTTTLSAKSLYRSRDLAHSLLVIEELEGTADVEHPLRVLQSSGKLRQTITKSGEAQTFEVKGPVAVLSGTTDGRIDLQNTSRCLLLEPDTSPEQTRAIQEARARAWAGQAPKAPDLTVWHDAQRLLQPRQVVVPFAPELRFPAATTTHRRGHAQLLALVAAHALLHQTQRSHDKHGRVVADLADYRVVHALLQPLVGGAVEELSPRAARAYQVLARREDSITRRELAHQLGWGYNTAKRALAELVAAELAQTGPDGPPARYALLRSELTGKVLSAPGARLTHPDALAPSSPENPAGSPGKRGNALPGGLPTPSRRSPSA